MSGDLSPDANGPKLVSRSGVWDDRRRALASVLNRQDSTSAELYSRALEALGEVPLTDVALVVASHCLRELVNRLPRVLGDTLAAGTLSLTEAAGGLADAWADHGGTVCQAVEAGESVPADGLSAVLPHVGGVVEAFHSGRSSAMARRSMLAVGSPAEINNPTVRRLKQATDAFERYRHPQRSTEGWPSTIEPLTEHLRVIEYAIEGRIGSFFDVAHDLRVLLLEANALDQTGEWIPPSDELLARAISRIGDVQHRRIFFTELQNPLWVSKLREAGALDPPPQTDGDAEAWVPWPAGPYLVAVAAEIPEEVAGALRRAVERASSREVHKHVVNAASAMPVDVAAGLVSIIKRIPAVPLDPALGLAIADLVEKFGEGGKEKVALQLGSALLRPKVLPGEGARRRAVAGVEAYWYGEALERFVRGISGSAKLQSTLVCWLELAQQAEGIDPSAGHDTSYVHRPSIATRSARRSRDDIAEALIDAVRDVSIADIRAGVAPAQVIGRLERNGYPILKRIARHTLAATVGAAPEVLDLAHERLLDRTALDDFTTPREYLDLARASLPLLESDRYREWEAVVLSGPADTAGQRGRIREHLEEGQTEAQVWSEYADRWLLNVLGTIGADALRNAAASLLDELTEAVGEPVDPSPSGFQVVASDEEEASYLEELRTRSVAEAIEFARHWTPSTDAWTLGDFEIGQAFATTVRERAREFSERASVVVTLPELLVGRFLDGLRNAIDADAAIEWPPLLTALMAFPEHSGTDEQVEQANEWNYPITTALHVIEKGLSKSNSGFAIEHVAHALDFTLRYVTEPNPAPDAPGSLEQLEGDPLTRALNAVQPVAVSTAVRIVHYAKANASDIAAASIDRVIARLAELLDPERLESSSVAAAIGSAFGQLNWVAPGWVEAHVDRLLSDDWYGDLVAAVALLYNSRPGFFFGVMAPKLREFIARSSRGEVLERAWTQNTSIIERIGEHLALMVLSGDRDLDDDLVGLYFSQVPASTRGAVLGEIGRLLLVDETVPEDVIERAQDLWDARAAAVAADPDAAAELREFYMWVHSRKFSVDWWLPRLRSVAELADVEGRTYLGEHLVEAASVDAPAALEILDKLIRSTTVPWARYDLVDHAPPIIARGLTCTDEQASEMASELTNYLGREGYLRIADLVDDAVANLDGSSGDDAIDVGE